MRQEADCADVFGVRSVISSFPGKIRLKR